MAMVGFYAVAVTNEIPFAALDPSLPFLAII
jgi:hypothetical protein